MTSSKKSYNRVGVGVQHEDNKLNQIPILSVKEILRLPPRGDALAFCTFSAEFEDIWTLVSCLPLER
jgi:hypothetical protein